MSTVQVDGIWYCTRHYGHVVLLGFAPTLNEASGYLDELEQKRRRGEPMGEAGHSYCPDCGAEFEPYQTEYTNQCAQCELEDNAYKRGD